MLVEINNFLQTKTMFKEKQIYVNMKEVPNSDFESTKRNEGGFGSSG